RRHAPRRQGGRRARRGRHPGPADRADRRLREGTAIGVATFRAGAAALSIAPPPGLPMIGFVRRQTGATGAGLPLEVTALVLEQDSTRVVLCGVDTLGIPGPEADELRARVAAATGAEPEIGRASRRGRVK